MDARATSGAHAVPSAERMTEPVAGARRAAAAAVDRIMRSGAYSNVLVRRTEVHPPRDHGYFQRLVYSTLRHLPGIDRTITDAAERPITSLEPAVLAVLRIGVADLLVLGTEPHAAVNEAVEVGPRRAAAIVNAVLRRIASEPVTITESLEDAYPAAVIAALSSDLGPAHADAFLRAANEAAPVGLRFRPVSGVEDARYARPGEDVADLERHGSVDIIDPASVAVTTALAALPGERILDLAAAPGGKTRALADAVGPGGLVVGADVHARRLDRARRRSRDLGQIRWVRVDGRQPSFAEGSFDRVLLDAPCTGLGTLRRRPEIRFRFEPGAPGRYGELQGQLLDAAMSLVRPGGRLVYSVCTPFRAETVDVVAGRGFSPPDVPPAPQRGDGVLLGPDTTGTDGMFIAVWQA